MAGEHPPGGVTSLFSGGGKFFHMLRSCKYCGRVHDGKTECEMKPAEKKQQSKATDFRSSAKWKKKRAQIMSRDGYLCRVCMTQDEETKNKYVTTGLSVHHIEPLHEDYELRLDDDNLITLCAACHERAEKGEISRELLHRLARGDIF